MTVFTYFDCYDLRFYNKGWGVGERYPGGFLSGNGFPYALNALVVDVGNPVEGDPVSGSDFAAVNSFHSKNLSFFGKKINFDLKYNAKSDKV